MQITGSTRPNRAGKQVADWFMKTISGFGGLAFEHIDLTDINLPLLDEPYPPKAGKYQNKHTKEWARIVEAADGYIVITPEYNHSVPAALKNAFDFVYHEWNRKPIAFVGYGAHLGLRAVEHLRMVAVKLQMAPLQPQVEIDIFGQKDEDGVFVPTEKNEREAKEVLNDMKWWSEALSEARNKES